MGPFGWLASASDWLQISNRGWGGSNLPVVSCALCVDGATSSNGVALLFAAHGFNKQIFGVNEQILGRDQSD